MPKCSECGIYDICHEPQRGLDPRVCAYKWFNSRASSEIVRVGAVYVFNEDTRLLLKKEPKVRFIMRRRKR